MEVRTMMTRWRWLRATPLLLPCLAGVLIAQPASAQTYWVEAPEFAPPSTGDTPELGDLDGDLDNDLIYAVVLQSYRNVGTPISPLWEQDDSLVEGVDYLVCMTVCLADLDADGDLDLSAGMLSGGGYPLAYYENIGSATQPVWQGQHSMYEDLQPGNWTCPELADLDDDGDVDLVLAVEWGLRAYRNEGTPQVPFWQRDDSLAEGVWLPHGYVVPALGDLDGDDDLDMILGSQYFDSPIACFENMGTAQAPSWIENEDLLIGVPLTVGTWGLDLADLDDDSDCDLLVIRGNGPRVYLNCGTITLIEATTWSMIKTIFR
jgi:hypothetical protein